MKSATAGAALLDGRVLSILFYLSTRLSSGKSTYICELFGKEKNVNHR